MHKSGVFSIAIVAFSTIVVSLDNPILPRKAICNIKNEGIQGTVSFSQKFQGDMITISTNIAGLNKNFKHGYHIHELNDLSDNCNLTGGHFNPLKYNHSSPDSPKRHVGDLGNLNTNDQGVGTFVGTNDLITLYQENSVIGKSVVVHEQTDDLGKGGNDSSLINGNSGKRIACCVITLVERVLLISISLIFFAMLF